MLRTRFTSSRLTQSARQALGSALASIRLSPSDDKTFAELCSQSAMAVRQHLPADLLGELGSLRANRLSALKLCNTPLSSDCDEFHAARVSEKCLIGLSSCLGATMDFTLANDSPIVPEEEEDARITRISPTFGHEPEPCPWHQDLAFLPRPPCAVALLCQRPCPDDSATTYVLDMLDIVDHLEPDVQVLLRKPIWRLLPPPYFEGAYDAQARPLLIGPPSSPVLRVSLRSNIIAEDPALVDVAVQGLTRACEAASDAGLVTAMKMQASDVLLVNNNMAMHTRTGKLTVCPENETQRLLFRMWLRFTADGSLEPRNPYIE